ncbi:hypothetical protein ACQE98_15380 [Ornithinimicrobium sp. W1679]|uniref:hypothetical protein n=1 Tax=unclassified Ornithinimicrobium TaxID=2615080 RepID=UPI003CF77C3B
MDEEITRLLQMQGGAASGRELQRGGFSRRSVEIMVRRGELVRVRRDALVLASALAGSTPWERQALVARAVGRSLAATASDSTTHALSHESALMVHGLPWFGEDGLIHLVRTDGRRGRRDGTVWVHRPVDARWTVELDGLVLVAPAMAALQVAATHGAEAGLVALDGVLHAAQEQDKEGDGRPENPAAAQVGQEVAEALEEGFGSATPTVRLVVDLADGRGESAGESRTRWLVHVLGLGPCIPQFVVHDGDQLVGIVDLKLARWDVLVEFDGTGKYTGHGALLAEKDREDRLRALGYEVVRLRWADLARPHLVRRRLLEAIARAEARSSAIG